MAAACSNVSTLRAVTNVFAIADSRLQAREDAWVSKRRKLERGIGKVMKLELQSEEDIDADTGGGGYIIMV